MSFPGRPDDQGLSRGVSVLRDLEALVPEFDYDT